MAYKRMGVSNDHSFKMLLGLKKKSIQSATHTPKSVTKSIESRGGGGFTLGSVVISRMKKM